MSTLFLALLPDNFLIIVLVIIGIALIFGILTRQRAFNLVGIVVIIALLSPFVYALFDNLPLWLLILLMFALILGMLRVMLNVLFGKGATDQFIGQTMFAVFALPFRLLGALFRRRRI